MSKTTEAPPTTLAAWLLAQLDEDEAVAVAAGHEGSHWIGPAADGWGAGMVEATDGPTHDVGIVVYDEGRPSEAQAAHIARHDPARVLAQVAAVRAVVEWHEAREDCCEEFYGPLVIDAEPEVSAGTDAFGQLTMRRSIGTQRYLGCVTLRALAAPYADRAGYDPAWAPT
jgi:hypothetical protein